jgi:hypothetical protein
VQGDNRELPTTALAETASPVDHHPHSRNRSRSKSGGFCLETIRLKTPSYALPALTENESCDSLTIYSNLYRAAFERTRNERCGRRTKSTRPLHCILKLDHTYEFLTNHTGLLQRCFGNV